MSRQYLALQLPGLAVAMSAVGIAIVLTAALPPARAVAQTDECLEFGPRRSASWALLAEAAKREICAREVVARAAVGDPDAQTVRASTRASAGVQGGQANSATPARPSTAPGTPRLIDDGRTLVLVDEVRAPSNRRQPEVRLGTNEASGSPRVEIAGAGVSPLPRVTIACSWSRRTIELTQFTEGRLRNVASYEVDESIARMVRTGSDCRVALGNSIVPLPGDLISVVWPTAP